ncbi:hypothetical protein [Rhodoplanes serenus]|uniref:hypothetical protein n=1 Tax=Rhodoplanes serenus TaxID=200615 RepID=UPI0025460D4E|nr:hypothetical protein [Rhodoplanes serenus]
MRRDAVCKPEHVLEERRLRPTELGHLEESLGAAQHRHERDEQKLDEIVPRVAARGSGTCTNDVMNTSMSTSLMRREALKEPITH